MKKINLVIFAILLLTTNFANAECQKWEKTTSGAFTYSDGKKAKIIKGLNIEAPANKIILIYNHGGWSAKKGGGVCLEKEQYSTTLGQLSGRKIKGKEIVLWMNSQLWKAGKSPEVKCAMKHKFNGKSLGLTPPWYDCMPVSYTHLTLPTKRIV